MEGICWDCALSLSSLLAVLIFSSPLFRLISSKKDDCHCFLTTWTTELCMLFFFFFFLLSPLSHRREKWQQCTFFDITFILSFVRKRLFWGERIFRMMLPWCRAFCLLAASWNALFLGLHWSVLILVFSSKVNIELPFLKCNPMPVQWWYIYIKARHVNALFTELIYSIILACNNAVFFFVFF